jgi:hypothetical protein
MIFAENRFPLFGIMPKNKTPAARAGVGLSEFQRDQ